MKTSEFDFELPQELIAQTPLAKRSASRLLVLHRSTGEIEHRHFYDIVDYLKPGDVLVRTTRAVIPARLFGTKEESRRARRAAATRQEGDEWECLVGNAKSGQTGYHHLL